MKLLCPLLFALMTTVAFAQGPALPKRAVVPPPALELPPIPSQPPVPDAPVTVEARKNPASEDTIVPTPAEKPTASPVIKTLPAPKSPAQQEMSHQGTPQASSVEDELIPEAPKALTNDSTPSRNSAVQSPSVHSPVVTHHYQTPVPVYYNGPVWGHYFSAVNPEGAEGVYVGPATSGGIHARYPYYDYRRPWYPRGPRSLNVDIVW